METTSPAEERLEDGDLAYYRATQETVREAQAVARHWSRYLAGKYRLGEGDVIHEDGRIVRVAPAQEE